MRITARTARRARNRTLVHAARRPRLADGSPQSVLLHVRQGLPPGRLQRAAHPGRAGRDSSPTDFRTARPRSSYGPDNTQSYEVGSKNNFNDRAQDRHQHLLDQLEQHPAECLHRGQLRPAIHRQSGHRGRQGIRPTGRGQSGRRILLRSLGGLHQRPLHQGLAQRSGADGRGHLGQRGDQLCAGHEPPVVHRVRPAIQLQAASITTHSCAPTGSTPAAIPGSRPCRIRTTTASIITASRIRCPPPAIPRYAAGMKLERLGCFRVLRQPVQCAPDHQLRAGAGRRVQPSRTAYAAGKRLHVAPPHLRHHCNAAPVIG